MLMKLLYKIAEIQVIMKSIFFDPVNSKEEFDVLDEKYFKDKFKIRTLDGHLNSEFPLGYKIKHSKIRDEDPMPKYHWVSIEVKINEIASLYEVCMNLDPNIALEEVIKGIKEHKEYYWENITTNKEISSQFMMQQIKNREKHKKHRLGDGFAYQDMQLIKIQLSEKKDKPLKIFNETMDSNNKKAIKRSIKTLKIEMKIMINDVNEELKEIFVGSIQLVQKYYIQIKQRFLK